MWEMSLGSRDLVEAFHPLRVGRGERARVDQSVETPKDRGEWRQEVEQKAEEPGEEAEDGRKGRWGYAPSDK